MLVYDVVFALAVMFANFQIDRCFCSRSSRELKYLVISAVFAYEYDSLAKLLQ